MRLIKFRGKRIDTGEWVYGSLTVEYDGTCHINYWVDKLIEPENNYREPVHEMAEVIPESVGQFTGLKDKYGIDIYEGDVVLWDDRPAVVEYDVRMAGYYAMWKGEGVQFHCQQRINPEHGGLLHVSVIDNIHDNPELLTPSEGGRLNTMTDPNIKSEEEVKAPTETEQEQVPGEATDIEEGE